MTGFDQYPELSWGEGARFLSRYASQHHAGAFATPSAKDLAAPGQQLRWAWDSAGALTAVWVVKRLARMSTRTDWTGRRFVIPGGVELVTHFARVPDAPLPDDLVSPGGWVIAYRDDPGLETLLRAQGRGLAATLISAASEVKGVWGPSKHDEWQELELDRVAMATAPLGIVEGGAEAAALQAEVDAISAWADDFPFYSDGSWDSVSLRGYDTDPAWGVKPREMGPKWHATHPGALDRQLTWTTLADRVPGLIGLARDVAGHDDEVLDRVRLMRMDGARGTTLRRHCDITDKDAGTQPGRMVRFFIPIRTHPNVRTTVWDLDGKSTAVHLRPFLLHYLDIRRPHAVDNPSGLPRVHLAIDCYVNDAVQDLLRGMAWVA